MARAYEYDEVLDLEPQLDENGNILIYEEVFERKGHDTMIEIDYFVFDGPTDFPKPPPNDQGIDNNNYYTVGIKNLAAYSAVFEELDFITSHMTYCTEPPGYPHNTFEGELEDTKPPYKPSS
ncbi:unnamed protein product [Ceratitis capitata]|uniref:(Mediterranean fruit fly) hypothetical protein n=1 Tax=Ceratitis capitata TaxID=7213 RepID=A0A811V3Y5_CERCA|nr:unnamed protein product [Ceratitis capitata]